VKNFDSCMEILAMHEGGFVNNKNDPGRATKFGITEVVARENGYGGDMRDLPFDFAKKVYKEKYWIDEFDVIPFFAAMGIFDACVNSGKSQAIKWLQSSIIKWDPYIDVDGILGPKTKKAMEKITTDGIWSDVIRVFNGQRLLFLANLPTWQYFSRGWARRIAYNLIVI